MAGAAAGAKRPRSTCELNDKLKNILVRYFEVPTVVKYGQQVGKTKLNPNELVRHKALLVELRSVQANMAFNQKQLASLLAEVVA